MFLSEYEANTEKQKRINRIEEAACGVISCVCDPQRHVNSWPEVVRHVCEKTGVTLVTGIGSEKGFSFVIDERRTTITISECESILGISVFFYCVAFFLVPGSRTADACTFARYVLSVLDSGNEDVHERCLDIVGV